VASAGRLIASGRDSDIYEFGPGRVLRRARNGRSLEVEARTMEYVRHHGYPVPCVEEVIEDGTALVMERIIGSSMMQVLSRRPWGMGGQARLLADLHRRLHDIEAPDWLPSAPGPAGDALLHLDLHPLNVMIAGRGPVVIDWPNAKRGDPSTDVALTWIVLEGGAIPAPAPIAALLGKFRSLFVRTFVAQFDRDAISPLVPVMVDYKVQDPHMSEAECAAMRRLAEAVAPGRR
jgi:aminoglycoside phosphotransferase (APT) family kinase protein